MTKFTEFLEKYNFDMKILNGYQYYEDIVFKLIMTGGGHKKPDYILIDKKTNAIILNEDLIENIDQHLKSYYRKLKIKNFLENT